MNVDESGEPSIWGGILDEKPAAAVIKKIEAGLAAFDRHKNILLDHLSKKRTLRAKPFDAGECWRRLRLYAAIYFLHKATPPAADREAKLRKLAKALDRIRSLADKVRLDNVGSELISQFFDGVLPREPSCRIIFDEHGMFWIEYKDGIVFHTEYFPEIDFKQIVARLDDYKAAVFRAANDVPTRKSGDLPFLPGSYIRILASTYQDITGRKPGAGIGPFFPVCYALSGRARPLLQDYR